MLYPGDQFGYVDLGSTPFGAVRQVCGDGLVAGCDSGQLVPDGALKAAEDAKGSLANNISNLECFEAFWWGCKTSPDSNSASPQTARATDLMCDAPSTVPDRQLRELGIQLRKPQ